MSGPGTASGAGVPARRPTVSDFQWLPGSQTPPTEANCFSVGRRCFTPTSMQNSYNLGGEQSGHVVFMDYSTTGDGLITALTVLAAMAEDGKPLSEMRAMRRFPQVLENIRVRKRTPPADMPAVERATAHAPQRLLWGLDWPHPNYWDPMPNDADLVDMMLDWVPDETVRNRIFVDNPAELLGFGPVGG